MTHLSFSSSSLVVVLFLLPRGGGGLLLHSSVSVSPSALGVPPFGLKILPLHCFELVLHHILYQVAGRAMTILCSFNPRQSSSIRPGHVDSDIVRTQLRVWSR